jgi:hypothetical protein
MEWFSNLISYGLAAAGIILASTITTKVIGTSPASSQNTGEEPIAAITSTSTHLQMLNCKHQNLLLHPEDLP